MGIEVGSRHSGNRKPVKVQAVATRRKRLASIAADPAIAMLDEVREVSGVEFSQRRQE